MLNFTPEPQSAVLSVEQLNLNLKQLIEGQFSSVWVKAEISNFKPHTSGHYYFSLKDHKAQISAVMFRGYNSKLKFRPEDGMEVIVRGRISVYEPRGTYQILCDHMEPVGAGALQKAFEQLKTKLKTEGLFEAARKKPIPQFPSRIAVVTSPTGAAIQDILNILNRRAAHLEVIVVPTIVQGAEAAPKISEALSQALKIQGVDVIIVGRGGGSIEDMWCFNDETLARQIAASAVPIISAVGHEIDFTICDFVADLRAPTPSAAAELVAKSSTEITRRIYEVQKTLALMIHRHLKEFRQRAEFLRARLVDPQKVLADLNLRNDDLVSRLQFAMEKLFSDRRYEVRILQQKLPHPQRLIENKRLTLKKNETALAQLMKSSVTLQKQKVGNVMSLLDSFSPLKVVDRGYSIVTKDHTVVQSPDQVQVGDIVQARIKEGQLTLKVESKTNSPGSKI